MTSICLNRCKVGAMQEMRSLTKMKRYMIHERGRGFEFQTNYDMNTEEFWNDLLRKWGK